MAVLGFQLVQSQLEHREIALSSLRLPGLRRGLRRLLRRRRLLLSTCRGHERRQLDRSRLCVLCIGLSALLLRRSSGGRRSCDPTGPLCSWRPIGGRNSTRIWATARLAALGPLTGRLSVGGWTSEKRLENEAFLTS